MRKASGVSQLRLVYSLNSCSQMLWAVVFFFLVFVFMFLGFFSVGLTLVRLFNIIKKQEPWEVFVLNMLMF